MRLNAYLHFGGNAEEALNFYKNILKGNIFSITRYGESPMPVDEDWKNKIMHARLEFDDSLLFISDGPKGYSSSHGNISLSLETSNVQHGEDVFNKLAEGGQVVMPMADQFWGARFGMTTDKYGIMWMVNCEQKKTEDKTLDITV
jgi:PhnB protein